MPDSPFKTPLSPAIQELFGNTFSVEFFPVRDESKYSAFIEKVQTYEALGIKTVNLTCKANNQDNTLKIAKLIKESTNMTVVPHLASYKLTRSALDGYLQEYSDLGIHTLFAIRGDMDDNVQNKPDFMYAIDLVTQIRAWAPTDFIIGVAGYPEGHFQEPNFLLEAQYFKKKVEFGADYVISQLFFDNRYFYDLVRKSRLYDIDVPIIPGIAYIKNKAHMERLAKMMQGSSFPLDLLEGIMQEKENLGTTWLYSQVDDLIKNNYPVHLYAFNELGSLPDLITQYKIV